MPAWEDSRITETVKSELEDLQNVLDIVSQCSKPVATRILEYCLKYVRDGQDVPPSCIPKVEDIKKMLIDSINKQ